MFMETAAATSSYMDTSSLIEAPQFKKGLGTPIALDFQEYCALYLSPLTAFDGDAQVKSFGNSRLFDESPFPSLRRQNSNANGDTLPGNFPRFGRNESVYSEVPPMEEEKAPILRPRSPSPRRDFELAKLPSLPLLQQTYGAPLFNQNQPIVVCNPPSTNSTIEEEHTTKAESHSDSHDEHVHLEQPKATTNFKVHAHKGKGKTASAHQHQHNGDGVEEEFVGCRCTKSHCLKLYCFCLAKGRACTAACQCECCYNNEEHNDKREAAIQMIKERHVLALTGKDLKEDKKNNKVDDVLDGLGIGENHMKIIRGCNCKKSGCRKRYCECFVKGLKCTSDCQCNNCKNCDHDHMPPPRRRGKAAIKKTSKSSLYRKKPSIKID